MDAGIESFRDAAGRVRLGWATALASAVGLAFSPSVLQFMSLGVFTPYLRRDLGWSLTQISIAATLLSIMTVIASLLQGVLIDRFGPRRLILGSLPLFGLGYVALAASTASLAGFYVVWTLLPLLGLGLWPASWVKATSSWFDRRLGFAIGVATTGIGIGATVFPVAIHRIAEDLGWREAFVVIGASVLLIAWPVAWRHVRAADGERGDGRPAAGDRELAGARRATLPLLLAAFALLGAYSVATLVHLVSVLESNGVARSTAVAAQSVLGLFMIAGRLGSGYLVDHVSVRLVVPAVTVVAATALAALAGGAAGLLGIAAAAGAGLLIGAEIDVLGFVVKRYFGLRRYGALYGLLFAAFQLGGAAGVLMLGGLREGSGSYAGGLLLLAGASLGAGALFLALGPYRFGREPVAATPTGGPATSGAA